MSCTCRLPPPDKRQSYGTLTRPNPLGGDGDSRTLGPFDNHDRSPGYLKAVWLKIVGPVFLGFRPKIDPGTPLDRRGLPGTSICTKNQPRRPILRRFRGTQKLPPDCLQVPSSTTMVVFCRPDSSCANGGVQMVAVLVYGRFTRAPPPTKASAPSDGSSRSESLGIGTDPLERESGWCDGTPHNETVPNGANLLSKKMCRQSARRKVTTSRGPCRKSARRSTPGSFKRIPGSF